MVLVFDISNEESFENITEWTEQINEKAEKDVQRILIGNKSDLDEEREVPFDVAKQLATEYGLEYVETSAKSGLNVDSAFEKLCKQVLYGGKEVNRDSTFSLRKSENKEGKEKEISSKKCCKI